MVRPMLLPIIACRAAGDSSPPARSASSLQGDVPDLLAVDQGAVHVEEHRGRLSCSSGRASRVQSICATGPVAALRPAVAGHDRSQGSRESW